MPLPKVTPMDVACFRSKFEAQLFAQMKNAGIDLDYERNYESQRFKVEIPARTASYLPDFWFPERKLAIEAKGLWEAQNRAKILLFREQHPDVDFRLVLMNGRTKIYKNSKTTVEQWAKSHNFVFAIGEMPADWLEELNR